MFHYGLSVHIVTFLRGPLADELAAILNLEVPE